MSNNLEFYKRQSNTFKDKIDFVIYVANWALAIVHLCYLVFYIIEEANPLILECLMSLMIYIYFLISGVKNHKMFGIISYICILSHTILGTFYFGWNAGYYQWLYGLICAYFLPSFGADVEEKITRPIYMGLIYIICFFILFFLTQKNIIQTNILLSSNTIHIMFFINAVLVFITIMAFTYFFTTRQKLKEEFLNERAELDQLTQLKNRYGINKYISKKLKEETSFYVGILDIDFFKKVNDTYGHDAGDFILKQIALRLKILEGYGVVSARWGGEEFIVISENNMTKDNFYEVLDTLRKNIEQSNFKLKGNQINITVSIGISKYNKQVNIAKVLKKADENLYQAKSSGRNKVVI